MGKIKILSSEVADQIAAGEVVERPASIVKELLDNAVDAGANEIEIRLENGGIDKIEIIDNGGGMGKSDLELAIVRYGTSKIGKIEDLLAVKTMGFRGEALASICAVSKFRIASKVEKQVGGWEVVVEGGKLITKREIGMSRGTRVVVEDLFFNVPARRKFLRTGSTEWRYCLEMVERLSLACPSVGIRLWHNGKLFLDLVSGGDIKERIRSIYGSEVVKQMFEVGYDHLHWKIWGMVGKPQLGKEKGSRQVVIVNDRVVIDRGIMRSVKEALGSLLPPRYQVPWILYLVMPGDMVDINVHPRKEEVRYVNPFGVYSAITKMIDGEIKKEDLKFVRGEEDSRVIEEFDWKSGLRGGGGGLAINRERWQGEKRAVNLDLNLELLGLGDVVNDETGTSDRNLGNKFVQMHNLYIVFEEERGMALIDQHAAHERIRYEKLMEGLKEKISRRVDVLLPVKIEVDLREREALYEQRELLKKIGIELDFVEDEVRVLSVPSGWEEVNMRRALVEMAGDLIEESNVDGVSDEQLKVLTYLSCRSAIKGGQRLTQREMEYLVEDLRKCKLPFTCPHGRPVEILITWKEMEKMFLRVGM